MNSYSAIQLTVFHLPVTVSCRDEELFARITGEMRNEYMLEVQIHVFDDLLAPSQGTEALCDIAISVSDRQMGVGKTRVMDRSIRREGSDEGGKGTFPANMHSQAHRQRQDCKRCWYPLATSWLASLSRLA